MDSFQFLQQMTVLVAEDDPVFRCSLAQSLELFVARVITVDNGSAALKTYQRDAVDFLILDIGLPELSGLDVARKIRAVDSHTPIFIVTAFDDTAHLRQAIPLQLVDYLIKPLSLSQIKQTLIRTVEYLRRQGELCHRFSADVSYNKTSGTMTYGDGSSATLTAREKKLLDLFLRNRNRLLTREYLEDVLFDMECNDSSLKNLVYRLKKKLPPRLITNVRDCGYRFEEVS